MDPLDLRVLPHHYAEMLPEHFARLAQELKRARRRPQSLDEHLAWAKKLREALWEAMMVEPEESDLNARVVGRREKSWYIVENLIFESRPGFLVTANFYLPKGKGPFPAVLEVHGHYPRGKFELHVQAIAVTLARAGIAVLAVDTVGYGDRWFQGHREGAWLPAVGMSLPGLILWDNVRALDYLQSREEVDQNLIGVTGSSGGGNQTMYLAALDERVKVAAPVASAEVFEDQVVSGRCFCECVPGMLRFADASDVLSLIAPRPLLIVSGVHDEVFPVLRARRAYLRVRRAYELFRATDKLAYVEVHDGHEFSGEKRRAVYRWFTRWLKGAEEELSESELDLEPDTSPTLSCLCAPVGETIATLAHNRALKLMKARRMAPEEWVQHVPELRAQLVEKVFGGFPEEPYKVERLGVLSSEGFEIEKLAIRTELDVVVPALLVRVDGANSDRCLLYLSPKGPRAALALAPLREWLAGGALLAIAYRGSGETAWSEELAAKNSLVLGRHILGMRVFDALRAVDFALLDAGFREVHVYGEGEAGLIALLAAALDERVASVRALSAPATLVSSSGFEYSFSLFPPRILEIADVPEIAAMVAPRPLLLENPLGPRAKPLSRKEVEELFGFAREVYRIYGSESNLVIMIE